MDDVKYCKHCGMSPPVENRGTAVRPCPVCGITELDDLWPLGPIEEEADDD